MPILRTIGSTIYTASTRRIQRAGMCEMFRESHAQKCQGFLTAITPPQPYGVRFTENQLKPREVSQSRSSQPRLMRTNARFPTGSYVGEARHVSDQGPIAPTQGFSNESLAAAFGDKSTLRCTLLSVGARNFDSFTSEAANANPFSPRLPL